MSDTPTMPPWMFNLEGTFLGFFGQDPDKPKSVLLEVEQEQIPIWLPKEMRSSLRQQLKMGDRICCIGRSQIDDETSVVKLQAYTLFSLPPTSGNHSQPIPLTAPRSSIDPVPPLHHPESGYPLGTPKRKQSKILVCKKSGCQKRGGRQLMEVLEQTLRDYQLHDQVEIQYSGCQKCCSKAPSLTIMPGKHRYERLTPKCLPAIIQEHFCTPELHSVTSHVD